MKKTMTKNQAIQMLKDCYGTPKQFEQALKQDFHAVKLDWDYITDGLCKDGEISQKQFASWQFPFKQNAVRRQRV